MIADTLAELRVPIGSVRAYGRNPRRGDVAAIKRSLEVNGQYRPIVVNRRTGEVLAGNHTWLAAGELGWGEVAATFVDVDDEQAAAIVIADNRVADRGGYDDAELAELLQSLPELDGTGWDSGDLDLLLASLESDAQAVRETEAAAQLPENPRSKRGDLYQLGPHRLLCGDCRDAGDVARLVDGVTVAVAVTSPPYADRRPYDPSSGFEPIRPDAYVEWFEAVQANVAEHLAADGSWFVNIKAGVTPAGLDTELYVLDLVLAHVRRWGWHFATEFCWERIGVPKRVVRRFKNQFEPVYQFARGEWKGRVRPDGVHHYSEHVARARGPGVGDTNWAELQGTGRPFLGRVRRRPRGHSGPMMDVQGVAHMAGTHVGPGFAYPGNRLPTFTSSHDAVGHAAAFPVGLPRFFVEAYSDEGEVVYDPFVGTGSTLLAAHDTGRVGLGMEISPAYCDLTVDRWERHTGGKAERL